MFLAEVQNSDSEDEANTSNVSSSSSSDDLLQLTNISHTFRLRPETPEPGEEGRRRITFRDRFCFQLELGSSINVCTYFTHKIGSDEVTPSKTGLKMVLKYCAAERFAYFCNNDNARMTKYDDLVCLIKTTFVDSDNNVAFVRYYNTGGTQSNQTLSMFEHVSITDINFCSAALLKKLIKKQKKREENGGVKEYEFITMKMEILLSVSKKLRTSMSNECPVWGCPKATLVYSKSCDEICSQGSSVGALLLSKIKHDYDHADAVFLVEGQRIKAHRIVLQAASPVLAATFGDRWKNGLTEFEGMKEVPVMLKVTANFFKIFLDLVYGHRCDEHSTNVLGNLKSLELANFYNIDYVADLCTRNLVFTANEDFSITNILLVYAAGNQYNIPDLKFRANQWLNEPRSKNLLKSPEGQREIAGVMQDNGDMLQFIVSILTQLL